MSTPHFGAGGSRTHPTYEWGRRTRTPTARIIVNGSWTGGAGRASIRPPTCSLATRVGLKRSSYAGPLYTPLSDGYNAPHGEVLELADRRDLGSRAARREGSSPSFPTAARRTAWRLLP